MDAGGPDQALPVLPRVDVRRDGCRDPRTASVAPATALRAGGRSAGSRQGCVGREGRWDDLPPAHAEPGDARGNASSGCSHAERRREVSAVTPAARSTRLKASACRAFAPPVAASSAEPAAAGEPAAVPVEPPVTAGVPRIGRIGRGTRVRRIGRGTRVSRLRGRRRNGWRLSVAVPDDGDGVAGDVHGTVIGASTWVPPRMLSSPLVTAAGPVGVVPAAPPVAPVDRLSPMTRWRCR